MPRSADKFSEMRSETLAAILDAALYEFSARGFTAATMGDVARRAGISKGLIYNHFTSKDELLVGVITSCAEQTRNAEERDEHGKASLSKTERLDLLLAQKIKRVLDQAPLNRLFFALLLQPAATKMMNRVEEAMRPTAESSWLELIENFASPPGEHESDNQTAILDAMLFQIALNGIALMLLIRTDLTPESLRLEALRKRLAQRFATDLPLSEG